MKETTLFNDPESLTKLAAQLRHEADNPEARAQKIKAGGHLENQAPCVVLEHI